MGAEVVELAGEQLPALCAPATLSRGLGRSYGDACYPPPDRPLLARTTLADRILAFDPATGELRAEAGLALHELNRIFLRRGWFTPVTPGTARVTLGGMVASDVHGKNHHSAGTIGGFLTGLKLLVADGRIVECSPQLEPELFWATVGGMGLTGHILEVGLRLQRVPTPWIYARSERLPNLGAVLQRLVDTADDWPMSVAWVDCLPEGPKMGRGILDLGRWATPAEAPSRPPPLKSRITVPDIMPDWLVHPVLLKPFFSLRYHAHWRRSKQGVKHPEGFFYPLDVLGSWNRMYGRTGGMTQYQCVLPHSAGMAATAELIELLRREGGSCFLCVIKDCGAEGQGVLSYPMPGISTAIDMRIDDQTQRLVDRMNEFVIEKGGRIYLTKDRFTRAEHYRQMEPRLERFLEIRRRWDPELRLRSALSVRLLGDPVWGEAPRG
jgi:FAD/FMN-containing dehydrogenase